MTLRTKAPDQEVLGYVRSLLAERTQELRVLERTKLITPNYLSCQRSLIQAIAQLKMLLNQDLKNQE
jgi:hypothetical protein